MGALTEFHHGAGMPAGGVACPRCRKAMPSGASFCRRCGLSLRPLGGPPAGWVLAIAAAVLVVGCLLGVGLYQLPGRAEPDRAARASPEAPQVAPPVAPLVAPPETRLPAPARSTTLPPQAPPPRDPFRSQRAPRAVSEVSPRPVLPAPHARQTSPPPPARRRPFLSYQDWRCDTTLGGPGRRVAATMKAPCTGIISDFELNVSEVADSTGDLLIDVCRLDDGGLPDEGAVVFTLVVPHATLPPIGTGGVRSFRCDRFNGRFQEGERAALVIRCGPGGNYRLGALSGDPSVGECFVRDEGGAWSPAPREADLHCTFTFTPDHLIGKLGRPAPPPHPRAKG